MDNAQLNAHTQALLNELVADGLTADTLKRALRVVLAEEQAACVEACQAVIASGEYDGHQQYAAAACRNAIEARAANATPPSLTEAEALEVARRHAQTTLNAAEKAWYAYAGLCEVGLDRTRAFEVYSNVRMARKVC